MTYDLYYYFRLMGLTEDYLVSLSILDRSPMCSLNRSGAIFLRANGIPIATVRAADQATFPKFISFSGTSPSAYIEARLSTTKTILTSRHKWEDGGIVCFDCVTSSGRLLSESAVFGLPIHIPYPLPELENTKRVGGKISQIGFEVSGASWYTLLQRVLKEHFREQLPKEARVMDWGVGCGRVARYFLHDGYTNLVGLDIDDFNVKWCQDNLPGGTFAVCDYDPPTHFIEGSFDLIYGHSVFTHLTKNDEVAWLTEINRLLSPGGIAVCTFASEYGSHMSYNHLLLKDPSFLSCLWTEGRMDLGALNVGVDTKQPGYYRAVTHTRAYINEVWAEIVSVLRIIPGFADNQDAVIFKKRPRLL